MYCFANLLAILASVLVLAMSTLDNGRVLKSLGNINSHFAMTRFNVNAQPYYAILDPETEEHKVPTMGYNHDVKEYVKFLSDGQK